ncbi:MAG: helix-turn-helix domain-containing protein [Rubrobacteraceae bacterium]
MDGRVKKERSGKKEELLGVEEVAEYLGLVPATVYRWCREGRLPCLKLGRNWRVRPEALEDFLESGERPETLEGQLRAFLRVPDNVLAIVQNVELLHLIDTLFFLVGEARGGLLVKFYGGEGASGEKLHADLNSGGLDVSQLEREGRFRSTADTDPLGGRTDALGRLLEEEAGSGRTVWASFDWTREMDLDTALEQQEDLADILDTGQLVVKTAVLEEVVDKWPTPMLRRAQAVYSGTMWLSENGLVLSRATPLPRS